MRTHTSPARWSRRWWALGLTSLSACGWVSSLDSLVIENFDGGIGAGDGGLFTDVAPIGVDVSPLDDSSLPPLDDGSDGANPGVDSSPPTDGPNPPFDAGPPVDGPNPPLDAPPPPIDAGTDASPSACDRTKAFGTPVALSGAVNSTGAGEGSFRLTADERTAFFGAGPAGGLSTLHTTTRSDTNSVFGNVLQLANVNSATVSTYDPTSTGDGLTLFFVSARSGGAGGYDIYSASRARTSDDFANVAIVANVNTSSNEIQPFVSADGREMHFGGNRTGNYEIYASSGNAPSFASPQTVAELNSSSDDRNPVLTSDRLEVFFSSNRPGTQGSFDAWHATRANTGTPFSPPVNVGSVNSASNDEPSWISDDGCRLYLTSDRTGANHIFLAVRPL